MANYNRLTRARASGAILFQDEHGNERQEDTMQCCHCGGHWVRRPGSGKVRGFCLRCNDVTCGGPRCDDCIPQELLMEITEQRISLAGKLHILGQPE